MSSDTLCQDAEAAYAATFSEPAAQSAFAPGRVNLLGEHTDYNGGFVLPMPLSLGTAIAIGRGGPAGEVAIASSAFEGVATRRFDEGPTDHWSDYVLGTLKFLLADQTLDTGLRIMAATNLPVGSGLSSSAALEIGAMRAASALFGLSVTPTDMAIIARKAENEFMGVPCGIMDQFSVSVGSPGSALYLNPRTLDSTAAPLPESHHFVVVHSGVGHKLSEGGYEQRVAECNAACAALGVEMLSDLGVGDLPAINALPAPLDGRARHIVTENARVVAAIDALKSGDSTAFARLMNESHASQRDDYAVSLPEIDALVAGALEEGADGARLTGGGFGGSVVAFVKKPLVTDWCAALEARFPKARVLAVT